ncbi:MAG: leucine-rich repeat domain-containing protein [Roseburia sp.]|nr:leucine-rich repeat domain-containing protein [Roseburia sp.]
MKKTAWKLPLRIVFFLLMIVLLPQTVHCAGKREGTVKGRISYSAAKGTLTISGTGAMPSGMKFKDQKKIKKVIVKKGITSLPVYAFSSLKEAEEIEIADTVRKIGEAALPESRKLKKITMPGDFQYVKVDVSDDHYQPNSIIADMRAKVDTIVFNSPLSLKTLVYVKGRNFIVSKRDKKYKSIKGVIYSKDGKSIVRVPAYRKTLTVEKGCEEFCIQAVTYGKYDAFSEDDEIICHELKKIILPASIRSVNEKKYYAYYSGISRVKEIEVRSKHLKNTDILSLLSEFSLDRKSFLAQFDDISYQDGLCINTRDASLLFYRGNAEELEIPGQITRIEAEAFWGRRLLKRVTIPDSVTWIGQGAFRYCRNLEEVSLPKTMTQIPRKMFQSCKSLKNITLPENVRVIGEDAFRSTSVRPSILLQGKIEEIGAGAFMHADQYSGWNTFELPRTVKKVGAGAFSMSTLKNVTVCGPTNQISPFAFINSSDREKRPTLTFLEKIGHWQTEMVLSGWSEEDREIDIEWRKITGVDGWQIQVSPDKSFRKKKTYYAKKEAAQMKITNRKMNIKYVRIRPYKNEGGKRGYGRWVTDSKEGYE